MEQKKQVIYLSAGGTGGHISPAISIAEICLDAGMDIFFFTSNRDRRFPILSNLEHLGVKVIFYPGPRLPRVSFSLLWQLPVFLWNFYRSLLIVSKIFRSFPGDKAIAFGGYVTAPMLWYVRKRVPFFLCEQNSVLGLVNRVFSSGAAKIFLSFPLIPTPKQEIAKKTALVGNPIRKQAAPDNASVTINAKEKDRLLRKLAKNDGDNLISVNGKKILLIMGGSQGARFLNEWALTYLRRRQDVFIILLAGTGFSSQLEEQKNILEIEQKSRLLLLPFVEDMRDVFQVTDCALARSGGSLYEIAAWGIPSVLVPYPYATDNHQKWNALYFQEKFQFPIVEEADGVDSLSDTMDRFLDNAKLLKSIRATLKKEKIADAALRILHEISQ